MSAGQLACAYAALILHDDDMEITAEKMEKIIAAAGVEIEPYWPSLYEKLFKSNSVGDLICNVGAAGPAVAAAPAGGAAGGGGGGAGEAKEEAPAEEEEEEEEVGQGRGEGEIIDVVNIVDMDLSIALNFSFRI